MQDIDLNEIWKRYDQKLEEARLLNLQSWALNLQHFEIQQKQKANSVLKGLAWYKLFLIFAGILWVAFLLFLLFYSLTWSKIFFIISAGAIANITSIAILVYIKQVFLISKINPSDSVVDAQKKISVLQTGTMQITRILFLQAPFYCTWFISPAMIADNSAELMFITLPVFLFLYGSPFFCIEISTKRTWIKSGLKFFSAVRNGHPSPNHRHSLMK